MRYFLAASALTHAITARSAPAAPPPPVFETQRALSTSPRPYHVRLGPDVFFSSFIFSTLRSPVLFSSRRRPVPGIVGPPRAVEIFFHKKKNHLRIVRAASRVMAGPIVRA